VRQIAAWAEEMLKPAVSSTVDGLAKFKTGVEKTTAALPNPETVRRSETQPPGAIPSRQMRDAARQEGTMDLVSVTANTEALRKMAVSADTLSGKLNKLGDEADTATAALTTFADAVSKQMGKTGANERDQVSQSQTPSITINLNDFTVREEADARYIARLVRGEIQKLGLTMTPAFNGA
jgi:hypothetical protein